ncbi:MAG: hypothetical protein V2I97_13550, partial [Desulfococcaceae bacterium]|nr:hypothetical protein [Desulfococcaceae bacterium]
MTEKDFLLIPEIKEFLPHLTLNNFRLTSPATSDYNCIAWVVGDEGRCWWPDAYDTYYWPDNVSRSESLADFIEFFKSQDYVRCDSPEYEAAYEKIVIYTKNGLPTHAAKQTDSALWSSKLGSYHDILHELGAICGPKYGEVGIIMKRKKTQQK